MTHDTERKRGSSHLATILVLATIALLVALQPTRADGRAKIHPSLLDKSVSGPIEFILVLGERADLREAPRFRVKDERAAFVVGRLKSTARRSQAPLVELLEASGAEYRAFWIANMIRVRADRTLLERLANRPEVLRIDANPRVRMAEPIRSTGAAPKSVTSVGWNISLIRADEVWALGFTGQGVVVGGQDTGYSWEHPALIGHYRGFDGVNVDHAYNWHDSIHVGGGVCGPDSIEPCDDNSHGTHTMGTMVGDDGGANQIGVSPGAVWVGCRNMNQGEGTPASYSECFEWLVAPTDANGENPDPSKAPDVINNSWVCPDFEGCSSDTLRAVVENTRAAGVFVVASAGNSGSICSTVSDPPPIYGAAFSVGATDSNDAIAGFSSRGPVLVDGSNRVKPDITAPGVFVRSSIPPDDYFSFNGTSMAGPHVVGVVALLLSARPDLAGRTDEIDFILRKSAVPMTSTQSCGGVDGASVPNNTFGWGRVDAYEAIMGDADGDSTITLDDCLPADATTWTVPGPVIDLSLKSGAVTKVTWSAAADPGASDTTYTLLRSTQKDGFATAECLATISGAGTIGDPELPADLFFYLVRTQNACGDNPGAGSEGVPRGGPTCP